MANEVVILEKYGSNNDGGLRRRTVASNAAISYGMILKITPTASPQQHIHTQLSVELSSLDPAHTTDGIPGILSRKLETAVTVKEKQTIVLSGLLSKNLSESQNKVPFLGDIPVLGNLFQVNRKREDQTELMIIVTPQLMETN